MADYADIAESIEAEHRADALEVMRRKLQTNAGNKSLTNCDRCDEPIPKARQKAVQGVTHCVACQARLERFRFINGANA
jgi:phage/conjugal plasmid C-4 type zinc finger TraR family protein